MPRPTSAFTTSRDKLNYCIRVCDVCISYSSVTNIVMYHYMIVLQHVNYHRMWREYRDITIVVGHVWRIVSYRTVLWPSDSHPTEHVLKILICETNRNAWRGASLICQCNCFPTSLKGDERMCINIFSEHIYLLHLILNQRKQLLLKNIILQVRQQEFVLAPTFCLKQCIQPQKTWLQL